MLHAVGRLQRFCCCIRSVSGFVDLVVVNVAGVVVAVVVAIGGGVVVDPLVVLSLAPFPSRL